MTADQDAGSADGSSAGAAFIDEAALAAAAVTSARRWQHTFGEMLIETRANGTVWIDGELVRDTAPVASVLPSLAEGELPTDLAQAAPAGAPCDSSFTHNPVP